MLAPQTRPLLPRLLGVTFAIGAVLACLVITVPAVAHAAARTVELPCDKAEPTDPASGKQTVTCRPKVEEAEQAGDPQASPETGLTPPPAACLIQQADDTYNDVACESDSGWWSNTHQCYLSLEQVQPPRPPGSDAVGAWYHCTSGPLVSCDPATICVVSFAYTMWLLTPPPGVVTLTPGQAARSLIESFRLEGITVGFAPDPTVAGSKSYVGVPIWMWVNNPTPLSFGTYVQSTTLGGVTITATAQVSSIVWNMGDGTTVACGNAGTPFVVAYGAVDSPTCGHRYARTSATQPGGTFPITATSQWQVSWEVGGESGVIPLTTTATSAVRINEIQSVNVGDSR